MTAILRFGDTAFDPDDLEDRVARAASALEAAGIVAGDVVALLLRNVPEAIEITLACNRLGVYHCPINWRSKDHELAYILEDCAASLLFTHADLVPALGGAVPASVPVLLVDSNDAAVGYGAWRDAHPRWPGPSRAPLGRFAYTSGTTGRPKGVRRILDTAHPRQAALLAEVVRLTFGFEAGARAYLSAPFYHGAPNLYAVQAMSHADSLTLDARFDAETTLRRIAGQHLTHLYLVPTMCVRLLALPDDVKRRYDLSSVRFVTSTGSPFPTDIKRAMIDWWGPVFQESYASSETGMTTTIGSSEWLARPGSVGRPIGEAVVRIVTDEGRECAATEIGNIHVRQPAYADFTYHNKPEARAAIDYQGLACVGDIGYLDADGYLFICDRKSDMVISGGVNLYPAETENALAAMPGVADCVVFGIPDAEFGEALAAVVLPEPDAVLTAEAVRAWLKPRIAGQKIPRHVEFRQDMPREDSGKIMKRTLRAPFWEGSGRLI